MRRALLVLMFVLCCWSVVAQQHNQLQIQKLNHVYNNLRSNYVDEVDLEPIVEEAIRASLQKLDPHSKYLSREDMIALRTRLRGEFAGVGIRYIMHDDTLVVRTTLGDSPARRAAILPNDRIISIDNRSVVATPLDSIAELLRGNVNSRVSLGIVRRGEDKPLNITLKRDNIESSAISSAFRIGNTGYIAISHFSKPVGAEFLAAYRNLGDIESLVVDLRDNGGGAITSAIDLTSLFLKKGDVIVSTEGRNNSVVYDKKRSGVSIDIPLVVIINERSASASEIFAGAIQDHDRGVIVGRTSYGKGLVQRVIDLKDGSGVCLTIARYKTPSGRVIQRPYTMGQEEAYLRDTLRYVHPDSISHDDKLLFRTLNNGRRVYGGGGITPDIYIASDTAQLSEVVRKVYAEALFEHTAVDILDCVALDTIEGLYPTIEDFNDRFDLSNEWMELFYHRAGLVQEDVTERDREFIRVMLRATLAEQLYGSYARNYIYGMGLDKTMQRALAMAADKELLHDILH